jgi:hypothetical protein
VTERERIAERIAQRAPARVCRYCGIRDEQVDGDRRRWLNRERNLCNAPGCIRQWSAMLDRAVAAANRRPRKRTPAEIHQLKLQEKRDARRRYRARKGAA